MIRSILLIVFGILLGITIMPASQAQPVSFVVRLGDGTNLASITAGGALKVDTSAGGTGVITGSGTAGTPSSGVVTVQGITGMTSLQMNQQNVAGTNDPCGNPGVLKSSVSVAISTATTTQLVALSASKVIYVCGFALTLTGTTPTVQFEYGTGASCGTGTTVLTGAFAPTTGSFIQTQGASTLFATAASNALCAVTAGTGPSDQGVLTYVQQ